MQLKKSVSNLATGVGNIAKPVMNFIKKPKNAIMTVLATSMIACNKDDITPTPDPTDPVTTTTENTITLPSNRVSNFLKDCEAGTAIEKTTFLGGVETKRDTINAVCTKGKIATLKTTDTLNYDTTPTGAHVGKIVVKNYSDGTEERDTLYNATYQSVVDKYETLNESYAGQHVDELSMNILLDESPKLSEVFEKYKYDEEHFLLKVKDGVTIPENLISTDGKLPFGKFTQNGKEVRALTSGFISKLFDGAAEFLKEMGGVEALKATDISAPRESNDPVPPVFGTDKVFEEAGKVLVSLVQGKITAAEGPAQFGALLAQKLGGGTYTTIRGEKFTLAAYPPK